MQELSKNWLTERHIDFEYKKYVLLSYLQSVGNNFSDIKLYPWLAQLIDHYKNTIALKENKQILKKYFPQRLSGMDENGQLCYEHLLNDDSLMQELEHIIEYAIPQFQHTVEEGKNIYDIVEGRLSIQPIGLMPLNTQVGYFFLKGGRAASTNVYEYQIALFESATEKFKAIHTRFIKEFRNNISTTFQSIKSELLRDNKQLPNPAAYAIESELAIPLEETFLPIAKRMLVKHLSAQENK